jgi:hypothetical protein
MEAYQPARKEVRHEQCIDVLEYIYSCARGRFGTLGRKLDLMRSFIGRRGPAVERVGPFVDCYYF